MPPPSSSSQHPSSNQIYLKVTCSFCEKDGSDICPFDLLTLHQILILEILWTSTKNASSSACNKKQKVQHLPKTCLTSTQCLGTHPPFCPEFNSTSFVGEIQKKYISFSIRQRCRRANCVIYKAICSEQSHQFSRDKYENFLLQKYEFPSDKLWGLTPVQGNSLLIFYRRLHKGVVIMKAFETETITDSESHLISQR